MKTLNPVPRLTGMALLSTLNPSSQHNRTLLALLISAISIAGLSTGFSQGTAFTYQGQLQNNGSLASGTFNLTFTLFNTNVTGAPVAGPVTNNGVVVTNGLFMVMIDFGPGVFTGTNYWLQIGVETNGGSPFSALAPRQPLTPAPYAIYAETVSASGISGTGTSADTPNTLVKRDGSGNFSAATISLDSNLNLPATSAGAGIIYSAGTRLVHAYGSQNFFAGAGAGNLTMTSTGNTANGYQALSSNSGGYDNTASGAYAMLFNTIGNYNTADGFEALYANSSGTENTAVGYEALNANTGSQNTAVGTEALTLNAGGLYNTANGFVALEFNTSGAYNTASGAEALQSNNGSYNTANGYQALYSNTSGGNNTALGYQAGYTITTGSNNIDIGNAGLASDNNLIRIGSGQTAAYIAGVLYGNAGGLTNLSAAQFTGTVSNNQLANSSITINATAGLAGGGVAVLGGSVTLGSTATNADLPNTIVSRDSTGNFSAATISLDSNLNLPATSATVGIINGGGTTLMHAYGSRNFFAGSGAGNLTMGGHGNTGAGYTALISNAAGNWNTALGAYALLLNVSGSNNTACGAQALYNNTIGIGNTASGYQALYSNTGDSIGDGEYNTADGLQALYLNQLGSFNTAIGAAALYSNVGNTSGGGSYNTAMGYAALSSNTSGTANTASGAEALAGNTVGFYNTASGVQALSLNTSGNNNTANGALALSINTIGSNNVANGTSALFNNTSGSYNTADGTQALQANTSADDNTAIGYQALYSNTNGFGNIAIGNQALYSNTGNGSSTGNYNTAVGFQALYYNTAGSGNIAVGTGAGVSITTGNDNIDIFSVGAGSDSCVIRIGTQGTQTNTYIAGISGVPVTGAAVTVNTSGQLGVAPSSQRFKQDIHSMDDASTVLLSLRPVTFKYKPDIDPKGTPQFGLVAEEVAKLDPDLVVRDADGRIFTVRYEAVNAMLLNEFLKAHRAEQAQEQKLAAQESEIQQLQQSVAALQGLVSKLAQAKPQLALTK